MGNKPLKIIRGRERLTTVSGLAIVGQLLKRTRLRKRLSKLGEQRYTGMATTNAWLGIWVYCVRVRRIIEAMREMSEDASYYCKALGINSIASAETVRQRLNCLGHELAAT